MVNAAGVADCAQGDGTYVRHKICPAIYKLLSVNLGMETGSAYSVSYTHLTLPTKA